jgi:hypothetical protein
LLEEVVVDRPLLLEEEEAVEEAVNRQLSLEEGRQLSLEEEEVVVVVDHQLLLKEVEVRLTDCSLSLEEEQEVRVDCLATRYPEAGTVISTVGVTRLPFSVSVMVVETVVVLAKVVRSGQTKGINVWAIPSCPVTTVDVMTGSDRGTSSAAERLTSPRSNGKSIVFSVH